jgi:hypothetical protein
MSDDGNTRRRRPHVPPQPAEPPQDGYVFEFNKRHFVSTAGGRTWVFTQVFDPVLKRRLLRRMYVAAFRDLYSDRRIWIGKRQVSEAEAWLQHSERRSYRDGLMFDPSGKIARNRNVYNLWRGFGVQPQEGGSWQLLDDHLFDNICRRDQRNYNYLIKWMAHLVQHPDQPGHVAVVLLSDNEGVGKSTVANALIRLFGQHGIAIASAKHLVGDFNEHLRDCVFLFADEAIFAGDKRDIGKLYARITEPGMMIEGKGMNAEPGPNYLHVMIASNNDWVVPAGLQARRWFVLRVGEEHIRDFAYFAAIQRELDDGGCQKMLFDLQQIDLDGFEVRDVPATEALQEQKQHSLKPGFEWWQDCLTRGHVYDSELGFEDYFGKWREAEATDVLFASYSKFSRKVHEFHQMNRVTFGKFMTNKLQAEGCDPTDVAIKEYRDRHGVPQLKYASRTHGYWVGNLATARAQFAKATGLEIEWLTETEVIDDDLSVDQGQGDTTQAEWRERVQEAKRRREKRG